MNDELRLLICVIVFFAFTIANTYFLWLPQTAPAVMLVLVAAFYSIMEKNHGDKTQLL
jgi:hypothetical protein